MKISFSPGWWLPVVDGLAPTRHGACGQVALSIDDGPGAATPDLLRLLRQHGARATFFLNGSRAAVRPDLVRAIADEGHAIQAHGWSHCPFGDGPAERVSREMERTEAELARVRPTPSPYLVRLPYASGHGQAHVHRALRRWRADCQIANWRLSLQDAAIAARARSAADLERMCGDAADTVLSDPRLEGAVVLARDDPFDVDSGYAVTASIAVVAAFLDGVARQRLGVVAMQPVMTARPHVARFIMVRQ